MSKIYNALNVNSENELIELVESLNLDDNQYIEFMTVLNSELSEDGLKMVLENLTKSWLNGSYEKLQEQCSKKRPSAKRELKKVEEDTVYDHSWYEVKGQKYPKRTKEGVICEAKEEVIEDEIKEEPVEEKPVSTADPELAKFIEQTEKVADNTTNADILQGLSSSVEAKIPLATDVEQMNQLGELKTKIDTKISAVSKVSVVGESYNPDDEEFFDVGDQVSFKWNLEGNPNANLTGTVREAQTIGGARYYNIASYNNKTGKIENFYRVDPVSNEMEKVQEAENVNETCSAGCCSAGSVAPIAKRVGKVASRKNKKRLPEAIDTKLFKESILNDMPCESTLEGHHFEYFMNEGKWYLSCDNALVKTYDKDAMIESVDEIINNEEVTCGLLEGYSCYEMNVLMEDEMLPEINIGRIAGVYDIKTNSYELLKNGHFHNLTEDDYENGKVRFGYQKINGKTVCYITASDKGYAYKTYKILKTKIKQPIDLYELEILNPGSESMFIKLDSNGHQIFENKNVQHYDSKSIRKIMEDITSSSSSGNSADDEQLKAAIISSAEKENNGQLTPIEKTKIDNSLNSEEIKKQNRQSAIDLKSKIGQSVNTVDSTTSELEKSELDGVDEDKGLAFIKDKSGKINIEPASKIQSRI